MGTRQMIATAVLEVSGWNLAKSYKVTSEVTGLSNVRSSKSLFRQTNALQVA